MACTQLYISVKQKVVHIQRSQFTFASRNLAVSCLLLLVRLDRLYFAHKMYIQYFRNSNFRSDTEIEETHEFDNLNTSISF